MERVIVCSFISFSSLSFITLSVSVSLFIFLSPALFVCLSVGFPIRLPPCWPSGLGICLQCGRCGFDPRLRCGDFSGSSHTSDFKNGTWCYRVSTGTGWPGVSIL